MASNHAYIEAMTALDRTQRPSADALVEKITSLEYAGYTRSCCFDNYESDTTSWQDFDSGDDGICTTANTWNDRATMSCLDMPGQHGHLPWLGTAGYEVNNRGMSGRPPPSGYLRGEFQRERTSRQDWEKRSRESGSERARLEIISKSDLNPLETSHSSNSRRGPTSQVPSQTPLPSEQPASVPRPRVKLYDRTSTEQERAVLEAFHNSHESLEALLLEMNEDDPAWQSRIFAIISQGHTDSKGFNILIMACKFGNTLLANDIIDEVVKCKITLIGRSTIFGNIGLNHAAQRGNTAVITRLINVGAKPAAKNLRGSTALHLASSHGHYSAVEALCTAMSIADVNAVDDLGWSALNIAYEMSQARRLLRVFPGEGYDTQRNIGGATAPLQMRRSKRSVKVIRSHLRTANGELEHAPKPEVQRSLDLWACSYDGNCRCEWCLLSAGLRRANRGLHRQYTDCTCPNHVNIFARDTLSHRYFLDICMLECHCKACRRGQEYKRTHSACGALLRNDYAPYDARIRRKVLPERSRTKPPMLVLLKQSSCEIDAPYPGHQYYDDKLIKIQQQQQVSSDLPSQQITAIVLKTLAEAGFRGSSTYRKKPNKALKWVIDNHLSINHLDKTVESLVDSGAGPDLKSADSCRTLMDIAIGTENVLLVKLLYDKSSKLRTSHDGQRAFKLALNCESHLILHMLSKEGVGGKLTEGQYLPAKLAVQPGMRFAHTRLLLAHELPMESVETNEDTALMLAVVEDNLPAATALLQAGANVNVQKPGRTPLGLALGIGNMPMISLLLLYGANFHTRCNKSFCALFEAIGRAPSHIVITLLREYSADQDVQCMTKHGWNCLHSLAMSPMDHTSELIDLLIDLKPDMNGELRSTGNTPLHIAAGKGKLLVVQKLLERGAVDSVQNLDGKTSLDLALRRNHHEVVKCLGDDPNVVQNNWWRWTKYVAKRLF
jgi:ankyrin repeat protein